MSGVGGRSGHTESVLAEWRGVQVRQSDERFTDYSLEESSFFKRSIMTELSSAQAIIST